MPGGNYFTLSSIFAFLSLAIIRGSFSVVIHFADLTYKSPSLVFLLRTPGTIVLYIVYAIVLACRSFENKQIFLQNLRNVNNFWKSAIMGFVQLAAPYLLFMYGLQVLSPTIGGVFMAAAPWMTTILERLPCVKHKSSMTPLKILAMFIGFAGITLVSVSDIFLALESDGNCHFEVNVTNLTLASNRSSTNHSVVPTVFFNIPLSERKCSKYTHVQVAKSFMALFGGCLMWSISSVFWRSKRGDIHYVMGGIWNNLFAGLYALAFWFAIKYHENNLNRVQWDDYRGIISILFLTILSGWIAALIVNYMYKNVGPASTNRVLCLVPLFTWIEDWIFVREFKLINANTLVALEVIGLVLIFSGLITSSLEMENFQSSLQTPLLAPTSDENARDSCFDDGYREADDGTTSEEEIDSWHQQPTSPFPPLVEVRPSTD